MNTLSIFDWTFIVSAILFNALISGIFVAQKHKRENLTKKFGIVWLFLFFPFLAVFFVYIQVGKPLWVLVCLGVVLVYMLVEFLLDYALKFDFRKSWSTHIPYILIEYAALFSLIAVSIDINQALGWVVSVSFWILMGSLIYLYTRKKKPA